MIKKFETWKIYQGSSLGDINGRTETRGNHPFIYLGLDPKNPYRSYGIMLTTKNKNLAVMTLDIIANQVTYILKPNIGFISNDDIIGVWKYKNSKKKNSHASIKPSLREEIVKICELDVFENYSLNLNNIDYQFTE